jgi:uncharacterized RDD family membrane protein YckC
MRTHPWSRLAAAFVDALLVLIWTVIVLVIVLGLVTSGNTAVDDPLVVNVLVLVVAIVPVVAVFAGMESGKGTVGKRLFRFRVVDAKTRKPLGFARALVRNVLKIAVPWIVGQLAVVVLFGSSLSAATTLSSDHALLAAAISAVLPVVYLVSVSFGRGWSLYDRVADSAVLKLAAKRRPASSSRPASASGARRPPARQTAQRPPAARR